MNRPAKYVNRKYFQRLLAGLLLFIIVVQLPFSIALQSVSKESVLNNINISNQTVLEQLQKNYSSYSQNISSLTSSIFWRDDIQKILYSRSPNMEEVYFTLLDLRQTIFTTHPDLHSICLYNKYSKELYTIAATDSVKSSAFLDFVKEQEQIPCLQPFLHTLTLYSGAKMANPLVFSYFLYQFNNPATSNESFLVLNQYANQSVSTIDTFSGTSDSVPTATYYVTDDAIIASKLLSQEITQSHTALIEAFRQQRQELPAEGSCYEDSINGDRYLVTYTHTANGTASLVIIQDYDLVFQEIKSLTNRFTIITIVLLLVSVVFAFFVSQQLYKPINNMYNLFSGSENNDKLQTRQRINEFDLIKHTYLASAERSRNLKNQESIYQPIALQYGISSLLLKNNTHAIEQFRRAHPTHWLSSFQDGTLELILIKVLPEKTASSYQAEATDFPMLLFAVQNVTGELLSPLCACSSFRYAKDTLGIIVSYEKGSSYDAVHSSLKQTSSFMEEHFGVHLAVAISNHTNTLASLPLLLQQALSCLSYVFLLGPSIITSERISANENNLQTVYPPELDAKIEESISTQDIEACKKILYEIKTVLRQFSVKNAIMCTTGLLNQMQRILSKYAQPSKPPASVVPLATIYGYIYESGTIDQCFDAMFSYIHSHFSNQSSEVKASSELFLNTVYEFVQNSYYDFNLSSQLISDHLGLSNRYLMKKFKALTGTSLNEYITGLRLRMAATFLRDTTDPISTIVEKVGIDNLSYFYRLFKKVYGCTPKEFRENAENTADNSQSGPDEI